MSAGLTLLSLFPGSGDAPGFIWRMAVCGAGFGLFQSPNSHAILSSAPRSRSGAAGGMLSTSRLVGQTLGAAGVAILFRADPTTGSNAALRLAAALALVAAVVSAVRLTAQKE